MIRFFTLVLICICPVISVNNVMANDTKGNNPIVILGAVPQEIIFLADKLEKPSQDELAGVPFWRGEL